MVKVKLLVSRTGGNNSGDVIEVSPQEAERMVAAGQCEVVRSLNKPEKSVKRSKFEKANK